MQNDIYNRNPGDPNYIVDQLEMDDLLELFKQEIESCLFTQKTSVLGHLDFGASLEEYVWSFKTSENELNYVVTEQLTTFCLLSTYFPFTVKTKFYKGTIRDIAEIHIEIDNRDKFAILLT